MKAPEGKLHSASRDMNHFPLEYKINKKRGQRDNHNHLLER